jgi:hypothetical protein
MKQVTGIGGVFFKVKDPKRMAAWYRKNPGIQSKNGFANFIWRRVGIVVDCTTSRCCNALPGKLPLTPASPLRGERELKRVQDRTPRRGVPTTARG